MRDTQEKLLKMLKNDPRNPKTLLSLGKDYLFRNKLKEAIDCFSRASSSAPHSVSALVNLGNALLRFGKLEAARDSYLKALALDGENVDANFNYANSLMALGRFEEAISRYEKVLALGSEKRTAAIAAMADAHEKLGDFELAFERIRSYVDQGQPSHEIVIVLAQIILNHEQYSDYMPLAILLLEKISKSITTDKIQRAKASFKLGHLYRKEKDYARSFEAFKLAHELIRLDYDVSELRENLAKLKRAFSELECERPPKEKFKNIFVMGLPRSGTSLIEKIIGVNDDVVSLGECNFFHHAVCEASKDDDVAWGCKRIEENLLLRVRSLYKQSYLVGGKPSRYVCDKSLENVFLVGQILQVIPEARIVWVRRDLRDVCLSCYASDFSGRHAYTHDLKTLARYAMMIEDLMVFWQSIFPDSIYIVDYEAFVKSPETGIKALVQFLGFDWDERYMDSHAATNRVKTLSYNDVQQPVYSRAVGRWENYKEQLRPLLDELNLPG